MKCKKIVSVLLVFAVIVSLMTFYSTVNVSGQTTMLKDVNADGSFNSKDILALRKHLAGMEVVIDSTAADVNFDGAVNSKDLLLLRKCLAGIITITAPTTTTEGSTVPKKYIALTFDDGPNTYSTPNILSKLKLKGAVATFFLIGVNINNDTIPVVQKAIKNGNEIATHSYSHKRMDSMTADEIKEEIKKTDDLIFDNFGLHTKFFRPPFLNTSSTMYDNIDQTFIAGYAKTGLEDWREDVTSEQIAGWIKEEACDGMIVLLHDSQAKNLDTISEAIPYLKAQGYEFVTLSQLFDIKGVNPQEYTMYSFL